VQLTAPAVSRVVAVHKARFQRCFTRHRVDLPSRQGTLTLRFTIASTGQVSEATTDLEGTQVSACVVQVVRSIAFPPHVDVEVRVPIALNWDLPEG
jgi:hypothetical protein